MLPVTIPRLRKKDDGTIEFYIKLYDGREVAVEDLNAMFKDYREPLDRESLKVVSSPETRIIDGHPHFQVMIQDKYGFIQWVDIASLPTLFGKTEDSEDEDSEDYYYYDSSSKQWGIPGWMDELTEENISHNFALREHIDMYYLSVRI